MDPVDPASRYCDDIARPWTICVYSSRRLEPSMAVDDLGLACPASPLIVSWNLRISPLALPQPANSQVEAYIHASALHPGRADYPRNPPSGAKPSGTKLRRWCHWRRAAAVFLTGGGGYARLLG